MDCRSAFSAIAAPSIGLALFAAGSVQPAQALLTYNIFETSDGNVVVQTDGSLNLPVPPPRTIVCAAAGFIQNLPSFSGICTGPNSLPASSSLVSISRYLISGPSSFNGSVDALASSVSGITTRLNATRQIFGISGSYISGDPIISSATFNNTTLAGLGFTTTGLIGTWTLNGTDQQIRVVLTEVPGRVVLTEVPGPLPLVGTGAAFAFSRKLRRRIAASPVTPPQV